MTKGIEAIADVFGMGRIQDLLTLLGLLMENGHSVADLQRYMEERMAGRAAFRRDLEAFEKAFAAKAKHCPACGAAMNLAPVNTGPRDRVDGGYQSQWICPHSACMETVFNLESPAEIVQQLGLTPPQRPTPPRHPPKRQPCGGCNGKA